MNELRAVLKAAAPMFVVALFTASLLYIYTLTQGFFPSVETQASDVPQPDAQPECSAGEKEACTNSEGCAGSRMCREGKWSECMVKKVCSPGEEQGCFIGTCTTGKAVCNPCGTAYENCTQT